MAPLQLDFITSDVFTTERYAGNPLGIVRVPKTCSLSQEQKLLIAREFNLSETTFLHEKDGDKDVWTVDIFMTTKELPFAGHPTIGTACYILSKTAEERGIKEGVIEASFNLKAGLTGLRYDVAKRVARAAIPHDVHIHKKAWTREELFRVQPALAGAFHQSQIQVKGNFPIVSIVKGMTFVLIELESEEALKLLTIPGHGLSVDGLDKEWSNSFVGTYFFVRTGRNAQEITLRTRMIEGTIEDPATGSAASDLAAYLSIVEGKPGETLRYAITQGVEMGRRSEISIEVVMAQDNGITRLYLEGSGVEVMEGRLTI